MELVAFPRMVARLGRVWCGTAWQGAAGPGVAWRGEAWQGKVPNGEFQFQVVQCERRT